MLLAGDIGATKTLIGLFAPAPRRPEPIAARVFTTLEHDSLEAILEQFLAELPGGRVTIEAASFGVSGPIVEQVLASVEASHPDLLAVGFHRGGPPGVIEAGSAARHLAHGAPCAVLTVPL
jgi:nucleotide-binding universal stress UspA family protein